MKNFRLLLFACCLLLITISCNANEQVTTSPPLPPTANDTNTPPPTSTNEMTTNTSDPIFGVSGDGPQTPITSQLVLSHPPRLEETAELTYTVTTAIQTDNTTIQILLPPGAYLLSGETTWQGTLTPEEAVTLQAIISFAQEGNWTIEAKALSPQENGDVWGDSAYIYLYTSDELSHEGFATDENFETTSGNTAPTPPAVDPQPTTP
ncbi:MAG TPA: hypothetical protein VLL52_00190 [Anaerolineae bacterium]|nr:hypothetical protein [Anaerolineae bacterium]